jgi:molybdopterin-guanine dinucleotide biosynthesis adapter protein
MRVFGLAGWSGSGKTTLMIKLLPELRRRGFSVSTVKHAHHEADLDRPGKDSFRHREAGAVEVLIASSARWALLHELRGEQEPALTELVRHLSPVDLLLIEGFKHHPHPKLEIRRPSLGKPPLWPDDTLIRGLYAGEALPEAERATLTLPVLEAYDIAGVADLVVAEAQPIAGGAG